jgi:tRNA pseudouridine65 synthase
MEPVESIEKLDLVYLDEDVCVVHKPAGLQVHRGMGSDRNDPYLLQLLRDQIGQWVTPLHRLDRPTSGLVVFALHHEAASRLAEDWREGRVRKLYRAIVRGWFPGKQASLVLGEARVREPACGAALVRGSGWWIDEPLDDPESGVIREAKTWAQCVETLEVPLAVGAYPQARYTLMELEPITGRWHQLRRHLGHLAHPIIGDTVHGCRHQNHAMQKHLGWHRLLLSAERLAFAHPRTGDWMECVVQPEASLLEQWEVLRRICPA